MVGVIYRGHLIHQNTGVMQSNVNGPVTHLFITWVCSECVS